MACGTQPSGVAPGASVNEHRIVGADEVHAGIALQSAGV
jgi:hypothetical protein